MATTSVLFTVETANRMLPLVSRIARDLVDSSKKRQDLERELSQQFVKQSATSPTGAQIIKELRKLIDEERGRIVGYEEELANLKLEVHSRRKGTIDFPSENESACAGNSANPASKPGTTPKTDTASRSSFSTSSSSERPEHSPKPPRP